MTFRTLVIDIKLLRNALLGEYKAFSRILAPTEEEAQRSAAFQICCHASVESFLEWRAMEVATFHYDKFRLNGTISNCCLSLVRYSQIELSAPPGTFPKGKGYQDFSPSTLRSSLISGSYKNYVDSLDKNNGLKEKNLRQILMPIGLDMSLLDPLWLVQMDNYGSWRGKLAHYARTPNDLKSLHPASEFERIVGILKGLQQLDRELLRLV